MFSTFGRVGERRPVIYSMKNDGRSPNLWLFGEATSKFGELACAWHLAPTLRVRVDSYVDPVRVIERRCSSIEFGVAELPRRCPGAPEVPTELAAISFEHSSPVRGG